MWSRSSTASTTRRSSTPRSRSSTTSSSPRCSSAAPRSCAEATVDYGVPLEPSVEVAIERHAPDVVLDLSDEPVLGPRERFALASRVLALGLPYEGPDFRFDPPTGVSVAVPTLAVDRNRQACREDCRHGVPRAAPRRIPADRRRRDGAWRPARARDRARAHRRSTACSSSRATDDMRRPTISRRRSSPGCRPSVAAAAAVASRAPSPCRTSPRASTSRRPSSRSS